MKESPEMKYTWDKSSEPRESASTRALFLIANELAELNANAALLVQAQHDTQETLENLRDMLDQKLTTRNGVDLADAIER